ncbi:ParB/RepB/Spo0J family partition protein [Nocardia bovistercoris]|uniref:ParB N-terminal domain-containing protein n=1 Tax=Nocardia bovistercoris TaxID=2785916 RepID=A0A931IIL3_9NOCA|nr:ParB N-terminal domain-containing protein [Nocardia bovistercoris]MBH0780355.1 ParB N-terminal domain-containing protein [Nocardia bovistercoris]
MAPAKGRRTSLASLASAVGEHSPVDERTPRPAGPPTKAVLKDLVANPRNPRRDLGDLTDLASIKTHQLQPALVVTRAAYLALFPDDAEDVGAARWVVINGCRRLAAAAKYGCAELEFVVKDEVAHDRISLLTAAIDENIGRRDFDVLEEAEAVDRLVAECGTAGEAARRLNRTEGWVSQRRALLKLAPELQTALREGELAVRLARSLAQVPREDQVAAWQAAQERDSGKQDQPQDSAVPRRDPKTQPASAPHITKALRRFEPNPGVLAQALRDYLAPAQLAELADELITDRR